jgi:XTP/dITP diphosphohydrolase
MKLLLATRNRHKLAEIRDIFSLPHCELLASDDVPGLPADLEEDADTFEGNALKKARALRDATGLWTLADDSGLEVAALGGAPGVHSARFAGEPCDHARNNAKLLAALSGVADRRARFRCVLALCAPDGREWTLEGVCNGTIAESPSGEEGFGYDPLFLPEGSPASFAAMPSAEKNRISHRARALALAAVQWRGLLSYP